MSKTTHIIYPIHIIVHAILFIFQVNSSNLESLTIAIAYFTYFTYITYRHSYYNYKNLFLEIFCNNAIYADDTGFRQTWKTWKAQGILFEGNYFYFVRTLIVISHVLTASFDHFAIFILVVCIFIFITQLLLYLNDL